MFGFYAQDLILLDVINEDDSVSVFHLLTTKLTSKHHVAHSFWSSYDLPQ